MKDTKQPKRDWRGQRSYNRRREALERIIDNPETKTSDVFNALEMLDHWQGLPEMRTELTTARTEIEKLRSDNAALVAEIAQLKIDLREALELAEMEVPANG